MITRTEHLIESFFAHELSETEVQELHGLLAKDPDAAAEFEWQKRLAGPVRQLSLAGSIQNATWREAVRPPFRQVTMWRQIRAIAAAIAVIAIAVWFVLPMNSLDRTVDKNFAYYPNKTPYNSRGGATDGGEQAPQAVYDAFKLYDDAKHKQAAEALGNIAAAFPDKLEYRFYQGVALLADEQYPAAAAALQPVADSNDSYKTASLYYLGLAYAGAGDKEQARKALQAYLGSDGEVLTYREQAQNVLDALK